MNAFIVLVSSRVDVLIGPWYSVGGACSRENVSMSHVRAVSRYATPALGETDAIESLILLLLGLVFQDWVNLQPVVQNLTKFYEKT